MASWVVGPLTSSSFKTGNINSSNLTASQVVATDGSKNLVSIPVSGSGSVVLNLNPIVSSSLSITANGSSASQLIMNGGFGGVWQQNVNVISSNGLSWNFNGSDLLTLTTGGLLNVHGLNNQGLTASQSVATDGSKNLVSVANTGSGNNVLATSPTLVTPVLGVASGTSLSLSSSLSVLNPGTGLVNDFVFGHDTGSLNAMVLGFNYIGAGNAGNYAAFTWFGSPGTQLTINQDNITVNKVIGSNTANVSGAYTGSLQTPGGAWVGKDLQVDGYYHSVGGVSALGGFSSDGSTYFGYGVGNWTPTVIMAYQTSETKTFSIGYNTQYGRYEKIGSQVTVYFYLSAYISASVGQVPSPSFFNIGGLPYPANDTVHTYFDFVIDPTKDTSLFALTGAPGVPTPYYPGPFTFEVNESGYTETLVLNPLGLTPTNVGTFNYDGTVMAVWGLQTNDIISGDIIENTLHIPTNNVVSGGINYQVVFAGSGSYISN
jgi:hypothetical protein